jgi:uncharacterized protein (DUF1786 family)
MTMKSKLPSVDSTRTGQNAQKVLVLDVGGSHVKSLATDHARFGKVAA